MRGFYNGNSCQDNLDHAWVKVLEVSLEPVNFKVEFYLNYLLRLERNPFLTRPFRTL